MITYEEALSRMLAAAPRMPAEAVALAEADGRILAQDVVADMDMPPFDKSAMDGYACRRADLGLGELTVIEDIAAGAWPARTVVSGTCARIFTGAPLPLGADCVLMQEQSERRGDRIRIHNPDTADNICRRAEDIRTGDRVLACGERLTPAHIAVLASVGVARPLVARRPRVAILATGNELVPVDVTPGPASIRNSNSPQLAAQARAMGVCVTDRGIVGDDTATLTAAIHDALSDHDVLLLSGGVSTGDYDLVPGILRQLGFAFAFESVAMQPGRPTVFAQKDAHFCCGLPGNPVSTFVVFELLVKPFLFQMMGHTVEPRIATGRLARPVRRRATDRQAAFPVRFTAPGDVEPMTYHGSAHINALTRADGIITLPIGKGCFEAGEHVHVRCF